MMRVTDIQCDDIGACPDPCACALNMSGPEECMVDNGLINYIAAYFCTMEQSLWLAIPLFGTWAICLIYLLISTSEQYFFPSFSQLSKRLRLSSPIAGVTLLAFSNAAPDVFGAISALSHSASGIALPALLGAGLFVCTIVFGVISLRFNGTPLAKRAFLRDSMFYLVATLLGFGIVYDGEIYLIESIGFTLLYILYILCILFARSFTQRRQRLKREALGIIEDDAHPLQGVPDAAIAGYGMEDNGAEAVLPLLEEILFLARVRSHKSDQKFYRREDSREEITGLLNGIDDDDEDIIHESPDLHASDHPLDEDDDNGDGIVFSGSGKKQRHLTSRHTLTTQQRLGLIKERLIDLWYQLLGLMSWHELSLWQRIVHIIFLPFNIARGLTIPAGGLGMSSWSRAQVVLCAIFLPMFLLLATGYAAYPVAPIGSDFVLRCWMIVGAVGLILGLMVLLTTKKREAPSVGYYMAFVIAGFLSATVWMYLIASELLALVRAMGRIWYVSEGLIGLTVVAWSNSLIDLVSDLVVARQGHPDMAVGACFGSPALSLLAGVGIGVTYKNIVNYPDPFSVSINTYTATAFVSFY
eukprot:TRINITY_DN7523_c0_g1_i2.p1 TRINITY_DN7523_c0_g1~~TRINITY_DN7523_c0_g1_i2.p1  ORF type:complete len:584 (-),score=82.35 TRINITY_DN7523_c0_g1_i2:231-1982(-)